MTANRYALNELVGITEAARQLGISERSARTRAASRNLGRIIGRERILTPDDVEALRERAPRGRRWPAKTDG